VASQYKYQILKDRKPRHRDPQNNIVSVCKWHA